MQTQLKTRTLLAAFAVTLAAGALTGCQMNTEGRTVGRYIDDRGTASRVEDALAAAPVYKFPQVEARTYQGITQLSGFVGTEDQRSQAEEIARRVPGSREIVNSIIVLPPQMEVTPTGR